MLSFLVSEFPANAGGPIWINNGNPVSYGSNSVIVRFDKGTLGKLSNSEAIQLFEELFQGWENVDTSSVRFEKDSPDLLSSDVNNINYLPYFLPTQQFGFTPILFDTDGSIIETFYGENAGRQYLGFGGPVFGDSTGRITESLLIINGKMYNDIDTDADPERTLGDLKNTIAHELGHVIGLDHSSINDEALNQYASQELKDSVPLMFPIGITSSPNLRQDDKSSISLLSPNQSALENYGKIEGRVLREDGMTPVLGANVIVRNLNDPIHTAISCISDYLADESGAFSLTAVPPGDYIIEVAPLNSLFIGPSGVGPYSRDICDESFLYPVVQGYYTASDSTTSQNRNNALLINVKANETTNRINIIANTDVANSRHEQCDKPSPSFSNFLSSSSSSGNPNELCCQGFIEREENQICPDDYTITFCDTLNLNGCCPTTSSSSSSGEIEKKCPVCISLNALALNNNGSAITEQVISTDPELVPVCNSGGIPRCLKASSTSNGDTFYCDENGNASFDLHCVPVSNTSSSSSSSSGSSSSSDTIVNSPIINIPHCQWTQCGNNCCITGCCESNSLVCSNSSSCNIEQNSNPPANNSSSDTGTPPDNTPELLPPTVIEPPIFLPYENDDSPPGFEPTDTTPSNNIPLVNLTEISSGPNFPKIIELPLVAEEFTGTSAFAYPGSNPSIELKLPPDQIKATILYTHLKDSKGNVFQNVPFNATTIPTDPEKIILSLKLPEQISTGKLQFTLFLHTGKSIHGFLNIIDYINIQIPDINSAVLVGSPVISNITESKTDQLITLTVKGKNFVSNKVQILTNMNDVLNLKSSGSPQTTATIFPSDLNVKIDKLTVTKNGSQLDIRFNAPTGLSGKTKAVLIITTPRGIISKPFILE